MSLSTRKQKKQLRSAPPQVRNALAYWVGLVAEHGLLEVRKIPGFHDEPLQGRRRGQRSIRLGRAWRAFYVIRPDGTSELIEVIEINKHDYR